MNVKRAKQTAIRNRKKQKTEEKENFKTILEDLREVCPSTHKKNGMLRQRNNENKKKKKQQLGVKKYDS